ncbi:unnamed protein product [Durusdinium trenchii]|uniref:J domain-containing protein n=1 Tax=Durusdinium trenchii TaxID=1381693 RepID=A0ABP0N9Y2_9DINO
MAHYETLKVSPKSSAKEIREAYLQGVRRYHPDVKGDQRKFQRLQEAYDVLGDPLRRRAYDQRDAEPGRGTASSAGGDPRSTRSKTSNAGRQAAPEWAKKGQNEALRWYRMPIPEFAWNVHLVWCRAFNRPQMSQAAFTQWMRQQYRASRTSDGGLLRKAGVLLLDVSAEAVRQLRLRLARGPKPAGQAWHSGLGHLGQRQPDEELKRRVRLGRAEAAREMRRQLKQMSWPSLGRLQFPSLSTPAAASAFGVLALSGSLVALLAWPRREVSVSRAAPSVEPRPSLVGIREGVHL